MSIFPRSGATVVGAARPTRPGSIAPGSITAGPDGELGARGARSVPEGSFRTLSAGVQAAVLAWLCAVIPAVVTYMTTAALPALGEATWLQAVTAGSGVWSLAHGGVVHVAGTPVTIVPLGLTLLAVLLVAWFVHRTQAATWTAVVAATLGYAAAGAALAALVHPDAVVRVALGALLVGGTGALFGVRRGLGRLPALPRGVRSAAERVPAAPAVLRDAGWGALLATAVLLGVGSVLALVSLGANHARFVAVVEALRIDLASTVMLLLACAMLLPTLVVWAVAWFVGPGFTLGEGTLYAPDAVVAGPVPALPVLAGLPQPGAGGPVAEWLWLAVGGIGIVLGWLLVRRAPGRSVWLAAGTAALAALGCAAVLGLLAGAAGGAAGPGRLTEVGPDAWALAQAVLVQVGVGAVAVAVVTSPEVAALARLGTTATTGAARRGARRAAGRAAGTGRGLWDRVRDRSSRPQAEDVPPATAGTAPRRRPWRRR